MVTPAHEVDVAVEALGVPAFFGASVGGDFFVHYF